MKYEHLFSPINIGNMALKNRLVLAPMATNFATEKGELTAKQIAYYLERAKGGVGLIIPESNYVSREGRGAKRRAGLISDTAIEGHKRLTDGVHEQGAKIAAQLHHAGVTAPYEVIGQIPVSCSVTALPTKGENFVGVIPKALRLDDIKYLLECYKNAARRAKAAGYDAVFIHGSHGYLINQFLSPHTNKRTDEYGGCDENRMRFLLEVIDQVRDEVGKDYPIMVRLSSEETIDGGYSFSFIKDLSLRLQEKGVQEINYSCGNYEEIEKIAPVAPQPLGCYVPYAASMKKLLSVPVGVVARLATPDFAEQVISEGKADLVYLGRELIADPYWPAKALSGKRIRPCLFCNVGCFDRMMRGDEIRCAVNYNVGRELEKFTSSAEVSKKVLVIGGGCAGMEAAATAAQRGHQVKLVEKSAVLGGQMLVAVKPPHKERIGELMAYLKAELADSGAEVELNCLFSPHILQEFSPDVVIVATGAAPVVPHIDGVDKKHVYLLGDLLSGAVPSGHDAVVIGGGQAGIETAEYLLEHGIKVTVVEALPQILSGMGAAGKKVLLKRILEKGVDVWLSAKVLSIGEDYVEVERFMGREKIKADFVVLAVGYRSAPLPDAFYQGEVYVIGDSSVPANIMEAIRQAADLARQI